MLPKATDFIAKLDGLSVKVSPATKPSPVPVAFMDMYHNGKKIDSNMFFPPGFMRLSMSREKPENVAFNKHYLKPAGPDECDHPSAEKFGKEYVDFQTFAEALQDRIKTAVAANPLELFKKPIDPACVTVVDVVEISDEYGPSIAFKMDLLNKATNQEFSPDNFDVPFMDVVRAESGKGVEMKPITFKDINAGDVVTLVTRGPYLTLSTEKNRIDGKMMGIVKVNWSVKYVYRVAKNGKRRREADTSTDLDWASDSAKAALGDYVV